MNDAGVKEKIRNTIQSFNKQDLTTASLELFNILGYNTERQAPLDKPCPAAFKESFVGTDSKFSEDKVLFEDWKYVDLLFQLSKEELHFDKTLFKKEVIIKLPDGKEDRTIIETYLFFAIELSNNQYSRTELSRITREVNRLFPMPVMILFKTGGSLTLSVTNRRLHKKDESKDVLEKVTLIKDIRIENPHRAHIEILFDLSFDELHKKNRFTNFIELHNAWQKTLDTKELNKRFFRELSNWYFWAMKQVSFPDDVEKNEDVRNATNLIRLITRIIFIWFIKEKSLVSEVLFDETELKKILKDFNSKSSNSYYKAILQNLFFGTLNQKMGERSFAKEGKNDFKISEYGVKNLFRYAAGFTIKPEEAIALFKDIPFLNGGLFDCLDKENDAGKVLYTDGFSRNPNKQADVPDFLFFGKEQEIDLSETYGDKKRKKEKVKGLFNILTSYKFTITENTPIEEEVALDPELLGKVFENLLASYNPETQTTARKQTGSFYTPREIVNYMVDESLKAYLKQKLENEAGMNADDTDVALAFLFEYNEKEHLFDKKQVAVLINAIDTCKILDPACGSGAFPMGILHKLVHILHKLDPNNEQWKERQLEKAKHIEDACIRDNSINDIEEAFANNEFDYGRKLYLIENCIFGVDIQPIAVQIAKLRFFISLVVDQKKQQVKENLGIRALPNLETKFVAANTLIGIDKPEQMQIQNPEIKKLEEDLKELRHKYFSAKTRKDKLNCQKKDKKLRKEISELLVKDGWDNKSAEQIAAFDPYDQNASSPFFEPEWMFGLKAEKAGEGVFDVVIGNPPYFNMNTVSKDLYGYISKHYKDIHTGYNDIVYYFIYLGIEFLNRNGCCTLITSNYYLGNEYAKTLRKYLKNHIVKILNFKDYMVFDQASIHTCISISCKETKSTEVIFFEAATDEKITSSDIEEQLRSFAVNRTDLEADWLMADQSTTSIINKLNNGSILLGGISTIEKGSTSGKNTVFTISSELVKEKKFEKELLRRNLKNGDIDRYALRDRGNYLIYVDNHTEIKRFPKIYSYLESYKDVLEDRNEVSSGLYPWYRLERPRNKSVFDAKEKIVVPYRAENNRFAYDNAQYFNDGGDIRAIVINDSNVNIKYVLALLNSKLIDWFYGFIGKPKGKVREYFNKPLSLIPIKRIELYDQKPFITIVDYIRLIKIRKSDNNVSFFESLIDAMVYELYFPDEIKSADAEVLKHLTDLPEFNNDWAEEKKLEIIENVYRELSDPAHPVSIAMKKMQEIEEIRIIEGKQ